MKIRPVGSKLSHADRQSKRHDKTNSRFFFLQYCERAQKVSNTYKLQNLDFHKFSYVSSNFLIEIACSNEMSHTGDF